jgi:heat shock protein HtpX
MKVYEQIRSNKRRTVFLIFTFAVLVVLLGWVLGVEFGNPNLGIIIATIIATTMTLVGYFHGDKVALQSAGAKKVDKSEVPDLVRMVENLSITAGVPTPDVYVINDPSPNAFATGRDPEHSAVAVTTGLMRLLDKNEIEGVIAHELSHIKNYDIRVMTLVVVLVGVVMMLADWLTHSFFWGDNDRPNNAWFAILGIVLAIFSPIAAQLIKLAVSRSREYMADASAVLLTRYPEGLAAALEKIAKHDKPLKNANHATAHLFLANPFDPHVKKRFERMFSTHPPIEDRIERIRQMNQA